MTKHIAADHVQALPRDATLADLIDWIAAHPALTARQRDDTNSAIRKTARVLGRSPSEVPAKAAHLNAKLAGFVPQSAETSKQRWTNVQSLLRKALKLAGLASMPARYDAPMAPEWLELHGSLTDVKARRGLSRLCRYFSAQGIAPSDVNDEVVAGYLVAMQTDGLIRRARDVHRAACLLWNDAADKIPAWPQTRLAVPSYSKTYILPWGTFPPSLQGDMHRYLDRLAGTDIFDEADFRPVRPATAEAHRHLLREAMAAFVHGGGDPAALTCLADLVRMDAVKRVLTYLQGRCKAEKSVQMFRVMTILVPVAKHWVGVEPDALKKLTGLCKRLKPVSGFSDKNRTRLRQFATDAAVMEILNLPQRLAAKVRSAPITSKAALLMQTAVMIEILIMTPLRLKNLAQLTLRQHIIETGRGTMHLSFRESEIKNDVPIERVLAKESADLIRLYLNKYRGVLVNADTDALFPGVAGGAKSKSRLREQLTKTILDHTGLVMNPHLFRHFAAKHYLRDHNGAFGTVRLLLAHKSVETTTRFYSSTEDDHAFRQLDDHVLGKRRPSRATTRAPTRARAAGGTTAAKRAAPGKPLDRAPGSPKRNLDRKG